MKNKIVIFGCGMLGKTAYSYYKARADIMCFVDNNKDVWGKDYDGVRIYSPEILNTYNLDKTRVVIAVKNGWEQIRQQLFEEYDIGECSLFQAYEQYLDKIGEETVFEIGKQYIIVCYSGGLGNQMFQYALSRCFAKKGKRVVGDVSEYRTANPRIFLLTSVFPNMVFEKCSHEMKLYYEMLAKCQYKETAYGETDMDLLEINQGLVRGYWQSYKYVEMVRDELLHDFEFKDKDDVKLREMIGHIRSRNAVSVHIRRGDYLLNERVYGNICTDEYYESALRYIQQYEKNITFCFFSNDIEWVSEKYGRMENAIFIREDMFDDYEDWYDMCLMSHCRHNIIANSSFSWWGAWLNGNPDKIVIAPKKWENGKEMTDICPDEWIRLDKA